MELKQILPFYLGAKCSADGNEFILKGVLSTEQGTMVMTGEWDYGHSPVSWWVENCDFKIYLKRLEDMSEEDAIEIARMAFGHIPNYSDRNFKVLRDNPTTIGVHLDNDWYDQTLRIGKSTGDLWISNKDKDTYSFIRVFNQIDIYKLLLSKYYDLFNLISEGKAIDAKSFDTNTLKMK